MSSVRKQVRAKIKEMLDFLFQHIDSIRVGIIVHNDYGDLPNNLVHTLPLTSDPSLVEGMINKYISPGGQGRVACYNESLRQALKFDWQAPNRVFVVIGDERPHEKGEHWCGVVETDDWKQQCKDLFEKNVNIYSVQCLGDRSRTFFYEGMSKFTNGVKLDLSQFSHINEYVMAIVHKQTGTLDSYEETRPEFKTNLAFRSMFAKLKGLDDVSNFADKVELLGKFQVVEVPYKVKIKAFVEAMGLHYRAGRGFYQFIGSEKIQKDKEVLFVDKATGETIMDTNWCREQMGLPYGTAGTLSPKKIPTVSSKYDIFIQSNSYTRDLDMGTKFLYEIDKG
jgi:hypothetical protein